MARANSLPDEPVERPDREMVITRVFDEPMPKAN